MASDAGEHSEAELTVHGRFVDAGIAIGSLLVEAGYLPSLRELGRVFERLYQRLAPISMDRPDAQIWLARGFLDGLKRAGFDRPSWMRTDDWMRWALSVQRREQPR